jgi:nicotinate phosphoribosyltransferase
LTLGKMAQPVGVHGGLYRGGLGLLTDLYQISMAAGYHRAGLADRPAVFHLSFRTAPFGGQWAVAAGLETVAELLEAWRFDADDLDFLAGLVGADGEPLLPPAFLDWLGHQRMRCDVDIVPEGTVVFPQGPLLRVRGPLAQAQLLETPLLTLMNFQTLIATKAARMRLAAGDDQVLEFGLRRAQGIDGGLSASRAAYIGGADATSNVLAGRIFGVPVRGTHAHAWVMVWGDEREAFQRYAEALPNNCVFLVDTYDTLDGVRHAVEVGQWLKARGQRLLGVRLDSGDLLRLSVEARALLDAAGFPEAAVVASNDLDEHEILRLKSLGAPIAVWGVGTRLATGHDQSALGGVYKLGALQGVDGEWQDRVKLSEQPIKVSIPGMLQVRRRLRPEDGLIDGDLIYDERDPAPAVGHRDDHDLLIPVLRGGVRVAEPVSIHAARARTLAGLARLPAAVRAGTGAPTVALSPEVDARRSALIAAARASAGGVA